MTTETLTPWFPGDVKPARDGIYERMINSHLFLCRFSGDRWFVGRYAGSGREMAFTYAQKCRTESRLQRLAWRGLAQDPLE